jgi:16S rRNA (guanine527-N7)-methyltransferase
MSAAVPPGDLAWRQIGEQVFEDRLELADTYARLLVTEGVQWGLLGPREGDRVWERHLVNSLCLVPLLPAGSTVVDIGSGAGLPGIPLALARADCRVRLVEPKLRRVRFLELCVEQLGLSGQVEVVRARAEEAGWADRRGGCDGSVAVCRAVAPVADLVPLLAAWLVAAPLLAIKGDQAEAEVRAARAGLERAGLSAQVLRPLVAGHVVGTVVRVVGRGQAAGGGPRPG